MSFLPEDRVACVVLTVLAQVEQASINPWRWKREECEEEVLEEAQAQIDSLIDTWVNAELFDTIRFPGKPAKPLKPDDIFDAFQRFPLDSITLDSTLN